jgi:hypothetical protein
LKRVIIIGADFTPSSMPPALRIRFFAQHLPEFGWEPIIITTDPRFYEWPVDQENTRLLPERLKVIRTSALSTRLTRKLGFGDIGLRTMWHHWRVLSKLCRKGLVDLVFIPVPPSMPMVLGRLAKILFRVPYVIDYIDPWITRYYWTVPKSQRPRKWFLAYALSRLLEPIAIKQAAHIVGVSKGTTDSVISYYPRFTQAHTTEIPYGGEPSDFDYLKKNPRKNQLFGPEDGLLHISYVGACIPAMHAPVRALFDALKVGLLREPELFGRIRVHFVGTTYAPKAEGLYQVMPIAEEKGIQHIVDEHPPRVAYLDALQILLDSHALLVIGSDAPHYTASKVFPNILAQRPVLALFHEQSSVVSILRDTMAGDVITFSPDHPISDQVEEIYKQIRGILMLPRSYQPPTRWDAFEQYTTRSMTRRLASVFDRAL